MIIATQYVNSTVAIEIMLLSLGKKNKKNTHTNTSNSKTNKSSNNI